MPSAPCCINFKYDVNIQEVSKRLPKHKNPWKTKKTKVVYKNPWIKVRENIVVTPNGKDGIYGVIEKRVGLGIVAVDDDKNVILAGQWRYPINKYSWSIIGGTLEDGESPLHAAKRELLEETNTKARIWKRLAVFYPSPEVFDEKAYIYLAKGLSSSEGKPEEIEQVEAKKVPFEDALKYIDSGDIIDGFAIVGLLKAKEYLKDV